VPSRTPKGLRSFGGAGLRGRAGGHSKDRAQSGRDDPPAHGDGKLPGKIKDPINKLPLKIVSTVFYYDRMIDGGLRIDAKGSSLLPFIKSFIHDLIQSKNNKLSIIKKSFHKTLNVSEIFVFCIIYCHLDSFNFFSVFNFTGCARLLRKPRPELRRRRGRVRNPQLLSGD